MALAGLPLLVIFLIFASGVYRGASRSYRVQTLEARWLGFEPPDADLGAEPELPHDGDEQADAADAASSVADDGSDPGAPERALAEQPLAPALAPALAPGGGSDTPPQPDTNTNTDADTPGPTDAPPEPAIQPEPSGLLTATADPVGAELRSRFDEVRVVRVKVLVDPALVSAREDWLSYVASLIEATHDSFEQLFGVEVQLQGVVIWDAATSADEEALSSDLAKHEREGADVILGLVARPKPKDYTPALWLGDRHGDHALVFADLSQTDRFYRSLLRALAGLLGAEPIDASSAQRGGFMSGAAPPPGTPPTLDPENRGKVIINKPRPFASSATEAQASEAPPKPKPAKPPKPDPSEQP